MRCQTVKMKQKKKFPEYYFDDYTPRMRDYIQTYKNLNIEFDGIATGFLGSEEQVDIVIDFIQSFRTKDSMILVDPVMGDYGKLYKTYTPQMCEKRYVPNVVMTVVEKVMPEEKIGQCRQICESLGVTLRVRPFEE